MSENSIVTIFLPNLFQEPADPTSGAMKFVTAVSNVVGVRDCRIVGEADYHLNQHGLCRRVTRMSGSLENHGLTLIEGTKTSELITETRIFLAALCCMGNRFMR